MIKYPLISELTIIQQSQSTDILIEVQHERKKQDEKWGVQNHAPFAWLAILGEVSDLLRVALLEIYNPGN